MIVILLILQSEMVARLVSYRLADALDVSPTPDII